MGQKFQLAHTAECARDCAKIAPISLRAEIRYANLACSQKRLRQHYSRVRFLRTIFPQISIFASDDQKKGRQVFRRLFFTKNVEN